jgi:hypothetical protein
MGQYYEVESGHAVPPETERQTYPFASMTVGQSFLVPHDNARRCLQAVRAYRFRHPGWEFVYRKTDEGMRVWRVA